MVKVLRVEGVANYDSPEPCVCTGNDAGEALAGMSVDPVLSREGNKPLSGGYPLGDEGRPHRWTRNRECP